MDRGEALHWLDAFAQGIQKGTLIIQGTNPYIPKSYWVDWESKVTEAIESIKKGASEEAPKGQG